jgi:hypothetical protein
VADETEADAEEAADDKAAVVDAAVLATAAVPVVEEPVEAVDGDVELVLPVQPALAGWKLKKGTVSMATRV